MAPKHKVTCRVCRQSFDAQPETQNSFWIMPSRNFYYHKECYESWKISKTHTDEEWFDLVFDLIARDLKGDYNYGMISSQLGKQVDQRMTPKGIYFTLYWYFLIKKQPWKPEYGIGIVPHVYKEATAYWVEKENKSSGICEQIQSMAKQRIESKPIEIQRVQRKSKTIKAPE